MFIVKNGLLCLRNGQYQIIIPPTLRTNIMEYFHKNYSGLHQSAKRTYNIMKKYIYWYGMATDIKLYVKHCKTCRLAKTNANKKQGYLQLFTPKQPFEILEIDIVGPLPVTMNGNRYILSVIDKFSRFVSLIPLKTITAENIAFEFRSKILLKYGIPEQILSDRGSQFTSYIFKILCKIFGIDKIFTTAYHPQTNGMIERFHRFLKERLRVIAQEKQLDFTKSHDWDIYLAEIEFGYNNTPNDMTQHAPYEIIYGNLLKTPTDKILRKNIQKCVEETVDTINDNNISLSLPQSIKNYIEELKKRQKIILKEMQINMEKYDKYRKEYYDKKRVKPTEYKNLEKVIVDVSGKVVGNKKKLNINRKQGVIIDKINDNAYVVQFDDKTRKTVNIKQIYKDVVDNSDNSDNIDKI